MAAIIVFAVLAVILLFVVTRSRDRHSLSRGQFIHSVQLAVDDRVELEEYQKLLHTPIYSDPLLESTRGRLVHIDDKYGRKSGEPLSPEARVEINAIADELRRAD